MRLFYESEDTGPMTGEIDKAVSCLVSECDSILNREDIIDFSSFASAMVEDVLSGFIQTIDVIVKQYEKYAEKLRIKGAEIMFRSKKLRMNTMQIFYKSETHHYKAMLQSVFGEFLAFGWVLTEAIDICEEYIDRLAFRNNENYQIADRFNRLLIEFENEYIDKRFKWVLKKQAIPKTDVIKDSFTEELLVIPKKDVIEDSFTTVSGNLMLDRLFKFKSLKCLIPQDQHEERQRILEHLFNVN